MIINYRWRALPFIFSRTTRAETPGSEHGSIRGHLQLTKPTYSPSLERVDCYVFRPASLPHPSVKGGHCSWHCSDSESSTARVAATSSRAHAFAMVRTRVRVAARILRSGKKRGVRGAGGGEGGAGWTRAPRRPSTHLGGLARRRGTRRCRRLRLSRRRGRLRRVAGAARRGRIQQRRGGRRASPVFVFFRGAADNGGSMPPFHTRTLGGDATIERAQSARVTGRF